MKIDTLKQQLQNHFTDGLVSIIGAGLSSAEGIPGMTELAVHLTDEIPKYVNGKDLDSWKHIVELLDKGLDIEQAMIERSPSENLESCIVKITSDFILHFENRVVNEVLQGDRTLRFTKLLPHLIKPSSGIPIITVNYDRLIELSSEMAGLGVDTLFVGHCFGVFNEKESRMSFCRDVSLNKGKYVALKYSNKVLLLKPHGSLDWFLYKNEPIRCPLNISQPRLIITPGLNKFRTGYDRPFDSHRDKANDCIDAAARFLIIGYGFNDDHLQTHLKPKLKEGTKALILSKSLSKNAMSLIKECDGLFAISAPSNPNDVGAIYTDKDNTEFFQGPALWDLGVFVKEVLEP